LAAACGPTAAVQPTSSETQTSQSETTTSGQEATDSEMSQPQSLVIMTHDSFEISESVVADFEAEYNADVQFLKSGDTGTALNQAILSRENPLADVFFGVDNTFLSRALEEDIFIQYQSPVLEAIPDRFELDDQARALPVDYGDVCINYDKSYFETRAIDPPANLEALLEEPYREMLAVQNPATSSPGLAFLLTTIGHFGSEGYLDYWQGLKENDVLVVNDWETAYYGEFTIHGGTRPLVVSYGSSPPAEVYFAEEPPESPPTGVISADESCFRQVEFVGILAGTQRQELAQEWVDFMLSPAFQEDMPLNMFVFPVHPEAELPPVFAEHLVVPDRTAEVESAAIAENRENWIEDWRETVLR
jgi:thiamine transport system substrate-binding protein